MSASTTNSTNARATSDELAERIAGSRLFGSFPAPDGDATVHILTEKVAPLQQSFYYVNDSMSADGRFLWFYCAFPPGAVKTLGRVDFEHDRVDHFPETQFNSGGASPYVDPDSGTVYWSSGREVWKRSPETDADPVYVNELPADMVGRRAFNRLATHLTPTADGRSFFVDSHFGLQWWLGTLPMDGSDYRPWLRLDRQYNHGQASPTEPDAALVSQEMHDDQITGLYFPIEDRMWLARSDGSFEPVLREPRDVTHEWWDPSGEAVWFVDRPSDGPSGFCRVDLAKREPEMVWQHDMPFHGHLHPAGRHLVGETRLGNFRRGGPSAVELFDLQSGTAMKLVDNPARDDAVGRAYHIDPHPRFCAGGRAVVFTTTVRGEVDVALAPSRIPPTPDAGSPRIK